MVQVARDLSKGGTIHPAGIERATLIQHNILVEHLSSPVLSVRGVKTRLMNVRCL